MNSSFFFAIFRFFAVLNKCRQVAQLCTHHLEEHGGRDGHPVQLDLEGGVEGEVAVVVAAAPLSAVAAVVDVHVQCDRLLLRHGGSCTETFRRQERRKEERKGGSGGRKGCKRRSRAMKG